MKSRIFYIFISILLSTTCSDLFSAAQVKKTPDERKKMRKFDRPRRKQETSEAITATKKEVVELYRAHDQLRKNLLLEASKLEDKEHVEDIQLFLKGLETILNTALSYVVNEDTMTKLEEEKKTLERLNAELVEETHKILKLEQVSSGIVW